MFVFRRSRLAAVALGAEETDAGRTVCVSVCLSVSCSGIQQPSLIKLLWREQRKEEMERTNTAREW